MRYILAHAEARRRAIAAVHAARDGDVVDVGPPTRSKAQNAALWPILDAFSQQHFWTLIVNGVPMQTRLEPEECKDILTAAFKQETVRLAAGLNGGIVMLGHRTSVMKKQEFSEFLEFLHATAAERGVDLAKLAHSTTRSYP